MGLVMRKPAFCICENKDADQLRDNRTADQGLCFSYTVQSLYLLNPKFQASSYLLWLYSPVCVRPGQKPEDWFSHNEAQMVKTLFARPQGYKALLMLNETEHEMSLVMRKPTFCICVNKDADQLCGDREADHGLCFRYMRSQSLYFIYTKLQASKRLL